METNAQPAAPTTESSISPDTLASPETPVTLTSKAVKMVMLTRDEEKIDPSFGLRIAVRGGGCSGFEYALDFEKEPRSNDVSYGQGDLTVFVDPISAKYLDGTEIDYVLGTTGAGFKFRNPKAVGTCGCGSSFAV